MNLVQFVQVNESINLSFVCINLTASVCNCNVRDLHFHCILDSKQELRRVYLIPLIVNVTCFQSSNIT